MIIMCGMVAIAILGVFLVLEIEGADTTEFRQWVNTIGQILVFPLLGVSTVAAVSAAKSASRTEDNSNGTLHTRDETIAALEQQNATQSQIIQQLQRRLGG
jgi:hypothetical protein